MKVATIIVNFRTPELTLDAMNSAVDALEKVSGPWRLTVVDNCSGDGSFDLIERHIAEKQLNLDSAWDNVEVVQSERNGGFGSGVNVGIRHVLGQGHTPDYFYFLNSDAFPANNAIVELVNHLDRNCDVGIVGSFIHGTDDGPHVTAFRFPTILGELEGSIRLGLVSKILANHSVPIGVPESSMEVDWLAGASMMVRSRVLEEVGLFDENYFLYFEETDLCFRAIKSGWKTCYLKESSVRHVGSASTGRKSWDRVPTYWLDSRRHFFIKNHGYGYYVFATLVRLFGEIAWRFRAKLQRRETEDLTGFVTDLSRHLFTPYRVEMAL